MFWSVLVVVGLDQSSVLKSKTARYTAQQKFSTDFNMMSHLNEHETFYFNVINMYGDFEINVLSCPPDKM